MSVTRTPVVHVLNVEFAHDDVHEALAFCAAPGRDAQSVAVPVPIFARLSNMRHLERGEV